MSKTSRLVKQTSICLRCQGRYLLRWEPERELCRWRNKGRLFSDLSWHLQEAEPHVVRDREPHEINSRVSEEDGEPSIETSRRGLWGSSQPLWRPPISRSAIVYQPDSPVPSQSEFTENHSSRESISDTKITQEEDGAGPFRFGVRRTFKDEPPNNKQAATSARRARPAIEDRHHSDIVVEKTTHNGTRDKSRDPDTTQSAVRTGRSTRRLNLHRRESLGVKVLGKEAEIMTMDDYGNQRDRSTFFVKNPEKADQHTRHPTYKAIMEEIANARKRGEEVDGEEVGKAMAIIQGRLKDGKVSNKRADLRKVRRQINDSFTHEQLFDYYNKNQPLTSPENNVDLRKPEIPASIRFMRASWVTSEQMKKFPHDVGTAKSRKQEIKTAIRGLKNLKEKNYSVGKPGSSKVSLIDAIIRDCWKLRPMESPMAAGSCDIVFMQEAHMKLLLQHSRDVLKQVSSTHGAEIQVSLALRWLRISGDYETCVDAFRAISTFIQSLQTTSVDAPSAWSQHSGSSQPIDKLQTVGQHTDTVITWSPKSTKIDTLQIYYAKDEGHKFQNAKRLLLRDREQLPISTQLGEPGDCGDSVESALIPWQLGAMPAHINNQLKWARRASPLIRGNVLPTKKSLVTMLDSATSSQASYIKEQIVRHQARNNAQAEIHHETSCVFGHTLIPLTETFTPPIASKDTGPPPFVRSSSSHSLFIPSGMAFCNALERASAADIECHQNIQLVLVPQSATTSGSGKKNERLRQTYLELLLDFDPSTLTSTFSQGRLICESGQFKASVPQTGSDMAFETLSYIPFRGGSSQPSSVIPLSPIEDFLRSSKFDLRDQRQMKTPGSLIVDLPVGSLGGPCAVIDNHPMFHAEDAKPMTFMLWALQHQSIIRAKYGDVDLHYKMIDGGKFEGRWEECRLTLPQINIKPTSEAANKTTTSGSTGKKGQKARGSSGKGDLETIKGHLKRLAGRAMTLLHEVEGQQILPHDVK